MVLEPDGGEVGRSLKSMIRKIPDCLEQDVGRSVALKTSGQGSEGNEEGVNGN